MIVYLLYAIDSDKGAVSISRGFFTKSKAIEYIGTLCPDSDIDDIYDNINTYDKYIVPDSSTTYYITTLHVT